VTYVVGGSFLLVWTSNTKFKQNLFSKIGNKIYSYYSLVSNIFCVLTAKVIMTHNLTTTNFFVLDSC